MIGDDAEVTGNDYVSIPSLYPSGAVDGINVLHGGMAGLVEWTGDAEASLLTPQIRVDGTPVAWTHPQWRRLDRWIPTCTVSLTEDVLLTLTVCAPGGYPAARGFLLRFDIDNRGRRPVDVAVAIELWWRWSRHWIATGRPLPGGNRLSQDAAITVLETDGGRGPALAIACTHSPIIRFGAPGEEGAEAANGTLLTASVEQRFTATPQRRATACFYMGAGRERDGALTSASALRRKGADPWVRQARMELSHILRAGQDHRWGDMLNRNLLFNRYFAMGRGIDDDQLYLLRSRSTRCPAPATFNEREALLWTIPALAVTEPGIAREALFRVLDLFSERSGEYQRYIDGGAFDTAFALDQLLLYPWAIDHYVRITEDASVLDEPLVRQITVEADAALYMRLHLQHMLCSTELLPSGDPADHPYTTYSNALLRSFCDSLSRLWPGNGNGNDMPANFDGAAKEVAAAVWQHLVTDLSGDSVFASSASLDGDAAVYDDPLGSLAMLPFFGFCTNDDPAWLATMEFLRSPRYPLWRDGAIPGLAGRGDAGRARLAALCADLLGPRSQDALDRLLRIRLPRTLAAGTYDVDSGDVTEPDHAALAGFLAWTLIRAAETREGGRNTKKRR
ncbi:hypothetical protein BH23GEM9_BH23GEM9_13650 [soil metagenome]